MYQFESHESKISTGRSATSDFIDWLLHLPKPVGLFVYTDLIGLFTLQICARLSLEVPSDVSVLGTNNDEIQCTLADPPLSSVMLNTKQIGYEAASLLDRLMDGEPTPAKPVLIPAVGIAARRSTDTLAVPDEPTVKAMQYIRQYACDAITVNSVADAVMLSRRTLERRFQEYLGCSPNQEILRVRMARAASLLQETHLLIDIIALRCGFQSVSHFVSVFIKERGCLPKEFRKRSQSR